MSSVEVRMKGDIDDLQIAYRGKFYLRIDAWLASDGRAFDGLSRPRLCRTRPQRWIGMPVTAGDIRRTCVQRLHHAARPALFGFSSGIDAGAGATAAKLEWRRKPRSAQATLPRFLRQTRWRQHAVPADVSEAKLCYTFCSDGGNEPR
jgi:hypothetical protein